MRDAATYITRDLAIGDNGRAEPYRTYRVKLMTYYYSITASGQESLTIKMDGRRYDVGYLKEITLQKLHTLSDFRDEDVLHCDIHFSTSRQLSLTRGDR